ncbi:uncharacterized protein LOC129906759 [Episyrphus balteatus]|uniref:uncharacterized protein LOC129906759 n=1 Tax=Episyrphus balteatus TaxID=286459 RepID=UPI00248508DD|nr:uncharacterized protein LOC129906759 [Episyrphus balteatus]
MKALQIHGFSDASMKAYGCCLYARCVDEFGNVSVRLITGKSRVAPTRIQSIPRLELCGAQLLAKLFKKVEEAIKVECSQVFFWVDSEIVLYWISSSSSLHGTFVANRVSDVQSLTSNVCWRHVRSENNPADLVSRGSLVQDLNSSIWFDGPEFLKYPPNQWPENPKVDQLNLDSSILETKKIKTVLVCFQVDTEFLERLGKYSDIRKTVRIIAYILRFRKISKGKNELKGTPLSADELNEATMSLVCKTISIPGCYSRELLRVGGRIRNSDENYDVKFPIILPGDSHFVKQYIRHLHIQNYHAGPQALLGFIRDRFWVTNARPLVRSMIFKCVHCNKYKPKLCDQVMGNLPKDRVTPGRPFEICGVDFCGPMLTSWKIRGKVPYKSYVSVFVCFVTKAVHLELVSDLSSDAFIAALKRLIDKGIQFEFIPPRAPHFGGIWEVAVKSAETLLTRTFGGAILTFEELNTALVEVEAILNSRPITAMSSDPSDFTALTPGHFLIGCPINSFPEPERNINQISFLHR